MSSSNRLRKTAERVLNLIHWKAGEAECKWAGWCRDEIVRAHGTVVGHFEYQQAGFMSPSHTVSRLLERCQLPGRDAVQ